MTVSQLVYLNRDEVTFGRLPTCTVVLDSRRAPQMISRNHGRVERLRKGDGAPEEWLLSNNSLNGILVNGSPVGEAGHSLQSGDVITFGRKMAPPEFDFIFEAPPGEAAGKNQAEAAPAAPVEGLDEVFGEQKRRISELQQELETEREKNLEAQRKRQASASGLNLSDLHSELICCICCDWLVHAATIECSHTFCWACIDTCLLQKKFQCPVCRKPVTREPVRTRAVDHIVQKSVDKLPEQRAEFMERVANAEKAIQKAKDRLAGIEKSVRAALKAKKVFFTIGSTWKR